MTTKKKVWLTVGLGILAVIEIIFLIHYVDMIMKILPLENYYFIFNPDKADIFGIDALSSVTLNLNIVYLLRSIFLLLVYTLLIISFFKDNAKNYIKLSYEEYKKKRIEQKKKKLEKKLKELDK